MSEVRYKPFGETRWEWGNTPTDHQFTGQLAEQAIGLYDYGARFYSPLLGRFVSRSGYCTMGWPDHHASVCSVYSVVGSFKSQA